VRVVSRRAAEIARERARQDTDLALASGDEDAIAAAKQREDRAHEHLLQLVRQQAETTARATVRRLPTGT